MTEHVYKTIELTGASKVGIDDAVKKAVAKAAKTLHHLRRKKVRSPRSAATWTAARYRTGRCR